VLKARSGKVAAEKYADDADLEELEVMDVKRNQVLPSDIQRIT
jgi:hypothetical protein